MAEEIKKQEKAADDKKSEAAPKKVKKKAKKRHLIEANVCIQVSFNNTIVTVK